MDFSVLITKAKRFNNRSQENNLKQNHHLKVCMTWEKLLGLHCLDLKFKSGDKFMLYPKFILLIS